MIGKRPCQPEWTATASESTGPLARELSLLVAVSRRFLRFYPARQITPFSPPLRWGAGPRVFTMSIDAERWQDLYRLLERSGSYPAVILQYRFEIDLLHVISGSVFSHCGHLTSLEVGEKLMLLTHLHRTTGWSHLRAGR
eukprot:2154116-Rhodomonas_salina.1